eukprot:scaffold62088_cov30-Tisochrysis_lutea.AAC.4
MVGSRSCTRRKSFAHSSNASYLAKPSSCQLCEMKASTAPSCAGCAAASRYLSALLSTPEDRRSSGRKADHERKRKSLTASSQTSWIGRLLLDRPINDDTAAKPLIWSDMPMPPSHRCIRPRTEDVRGSPRTKPKNDHHAACWRYGGMPSPMEV